MNYSNNRIFYSTHAQHYSYSSSSCLCNEKATKKSSTGYKMGSLSSWTIIWMTWVTLAITNGQQDGSTVLTIQNEPTNPNYFKPITISSEIFERLSLCLCNRVIGRCVLQYSKTLEHVTYSTINGSSQSLCSDYFTCQNYQSTNNVTCIRQTSSSLMCPTNVGQPTSPKQVSILSCNNSCVGIIWNSDRESLKHNQVMNEKTYTCGDKWGEINPTTKSITSTSTSKSITIKSSSTGFTTTVTTTKRTKSPTTSGPITAAGGITTEAIILSRNDEDNTTPILIGVVVSLIVIIVIMVGIFVFVVRRMKRRKRTPDGKDKCFNDTTADVNSNVISNIHANDGQNDRLARLSETTNINDNNNKATNDNPEYGYAEVVIPDLTHSSTTEGNSPKEVLTTNSSPNTCDVIDGHYENLDVDAGYIYPLKNQPTYEDVSVSQANQSAEPYYNMDNNKPIESKPETPYTNVIQEDERPVGKRLSLSSGFRQMEVSDQTNIMKNPKSVEYFNEVN